MEGSLAGTIADVQVGEVRNENLWEGRGGEGRGGEVHVLSSQGLKNLVHLVTCSLSS